MLAGMRAMLGAGEAFNTPCALRVTANVLPPADRALGNGLFNSGAAAGALIAPLLISPIADAWGWRWAFLTVGGLGAGWIVLWLGFTRSRCVEGSSTGKKGTLPICAPGRGLSPFSSLGEQLAATLGHPAFWLLAIASATINPCWYFCSDWIPKYMHDQRGFAELSAGLITIPIFLGADVGNLAGGAAAKLLATRQWPVRRARAATSFIAAALIVPVGAVGYVANPYLSIALLAAAAFGIMALMANYLAAIQGFSLARVGFVAGILGAIANVMGAVASLLIGRYVDHSGHYNLVFLMVAVTPLAGMAAVVAADALVAKTPTPADEP